MHTAYNITRGKELHEIEGKKTIMRTHVQNIVYHNIYRKTVQTGNYILT